MPFQPNAKMKNARRERLKAFKKYMGETGFAVPRMDELTDEQWQLVEPLLPAGNSHGRPSHDQRLVLNGIFFYIRNALTWINIPPEYPSYVTCFRRYTAWAESGVLEKIIFRLSHHLADASGLDFFTAYKKGTVSYGMQGNTLTIYLPQEYASYWMQPTAALVMMWLLTRAMDAYREAYKRTCKKLECDRLIGQAGPRSIRPRFVEVVIGEKPQQVKVSKPVMHRERLEFLERMAR